MLPDGNLHCAVSLLPMETQICILQMDGRVFLKCVVCLQVRSFYSSLAKAIHQHPRRRGDESLPVSGPMRSAALYLGLVMKHSYEKLAPAASTSQVWRPGRKAM